MTSRRLPPAPPQLSRGIPPTPPANPTGTTPRHPFDLSLINSEVDTQTDLRVVRDAHGVPIFQEASAPALVDTLNTDTDRENITYSMTPPEQGKTNVVMDFSKGLTQDPLGHYQKGAYAWGEKIWTLDAGGLALRAPALTTIAKLAGLAAAPGALTTSVVAGGSLLSGVAHNVKVAAVDVNGVQSAPTTGTARTPSAGNLTFRVAFAAVTNAVSYRIYLSTDTDPLFIGTVTEAQRASGIKLTAQNTTAAGGTAGAVDVELAGAGNVAATPAALSDRIESVCTHNAQSWFSAGTKVYYLTEVNSALVIHEPAHQPSGSFRITRIFDWQGILLVAHDTQNPYEWSDDDGLTWHVAGLSAPATLSATLAAGGSLSLLTDYYYRVAGVDQYGNESAALSGGPIQVSGGNLSVRLAFPKVTNAVSYRIYLSAHADPYFVGHITEAQRASGILITAQDTTGAGGSAGGVTVQVAGNGNLTTALQAGGSLVNTSIYNATVTALSTPTDTTPGTEFVAFLGTPRTAATPNLTIRIPFAKVEGAYGYGIYLSTDALPKFVAFITEDQRAAGCVVVNQDTVIEGGTPGAVDVRVPGTGTVASISPLAQTASAAALQMYGKFFASYQESAAGINPSRPILLMCNDPNQVFSTENPEDASQWDSGSLVGPGGTFNQDHFTSLHVTGTGELIVGKALHLYQLDAASDATFQRAASVSGDVSVKMGPLPQSRDIGQENFAWPVNIGFSVYMVTKDFDITQVQPRRLSQNTTATLLVPTQGFGPAFKLPAVQEAQKGITAMATDSRSLFASLSGTEGYVLVGRESQDAQGNSAFEWHGAIARAGWPIRQMWVESFPNTSDIFQDQYLFVARNDSPYTLAAMRLPRAGIVWDANVTFETTGFLRFGKDYGGQAQVEKVLSRATPRTLNLDNPNPTVQIDYRVSEGAAFTTLATFHTSPLPSVAELPSTYAPTGVYGTFVELQATLTGDTAVHAALESIEYQVFRRPVRKDLITCTVYADNTGMTREGGRRWASWTQIRQELKACRNAIVPPVLIDQETGVRWTVDIQQWTRRWMLDNDGSGSAMVIDLVMQELDTSAAPASGIPGTVSSFHVHAYEEFTISGTTYTLSFVPAIQPEVFADNVFQMGDGNDYGWTAGSRTLTFVAPPAGTTLRVYYEYLPS